MTNEEIQKHIEQNCRHAHGEPMMDEQAFYDGAKWMRDKALSLGAAMPRFLKTKYTLEELDQYIMELSGRTDRHIHRGKLDDIEKLIRWRRRYDTLNGV